MPQLGDPWVFWHPNHATRLDLPASGVQLAFRPLHHNPEFQKGSRCLVYNPTHAAELLGLIEAGRVKVQKQSGPDLDAIEPAPVARFVREVAGDGGAATDVAIAKAVEAKLEAAELKAELAELKKAKRGRAKKGADE